MSRSLDTIIAAIARANDLIVVTDNERDFDGVEIVNPLRSAPATDEPRGDECWRR